MKTPGETPMTVAQVIETQPSPELLFRSGRPKLRAVIADDSRSYMEVICTLIELDDIVEVVGRACDGAEAIEATAHLQPDLLIMDVEMPFIDGVTAASFLSQHFPLIRIVLMSADDSAELREDCVAAGAHAFIHKPDFREDCAAVLCAICDSTRAIDPNRDYD
jgi:two-component system, NarL family, response regulator DesR